MFWRKYQNNRGVVIRQTVKLCQLLCWGRYWSHGSWCDLSEYDLPFEAIALGANWRILAVLASFSRGWRSSSFPTRREELMIGNLDSDEEEGEGDEVDELDRL